MEEYTGTSGRYYISPFLNQNVFPLLCSHLPLGITNNIHVQTLFYHFSIAHGSLWHAWF